MAFEDSNLHRSRKFISNCTINRDHHLMFTDTQSSNCVSIDTLAEKLFKDQIKSKLEELTREFDLFWDKIKNELKIRYNALIGTFER
jgi:hypothetical protein